MERHYLVYCINRIHNRIDILDSIYYKWINTSPEPRHAPIFEKIPIINAAFQKVSKKKFPNFENWSRPFIDVPKQAGPCDCMFFVWKYMEHWDGDKLHAEINPMSCYSFFFPSKAVGLFFQHFPCFILSLFLWLSIFSVQGQYLQGRAHALCDLPPAEPG
jgi:hypothetical protein